MVTEVINPNDPHIDRECNIETVCLFQNRNDFIAHVITATEEQVEKLQSLFVGFCATFHPTQHI